MPQSLVQIYIHIVFSTKNRTPFLQDEKVRTHTHSYLAGICKNLKCPPIIIGGVADHVHILTRLSKTIEISNLILNLKILTQGGASLTLGYVVYLLRSFL